MLKKILCYLISFFIFYTPFFAHAASNQEKWNNARNQEIRNTIGQNATYGNNSGRITVRNYDATKKMVEASLSRSATVNGSKASVEAAVKVPVNLGKVAATTAKRLARGGVAGMLGGAAVQLLLDGAGWVMDPANNTIKKPASDVSPTDPSNQFIYKSNTSNKYYSNEINACDYLKIVNNGTGISGASFAYADYNTQICYYSYDGDVLGWSTYNREVNPNYDPSASAPSSQPVSNDDLANEIQKRADAGDPAAQQLIKDAYQAVDALGNATKDLGAAVDGLNDAVKDLTDAFDKIVKSDDPVATGNTDTVPTITTGGEASGDTDTQNKDKDGNDTGSSNSTSNFQLPAFCDWAADNCEWHQEDKKHQADQKTFWDKVTDWFSWTKDESDLPDRDDTDLNITTDFEEKTVTLNVSAQCPAPTYETVVLHGVTSQVKTSDYSFICSLDWLIKPFVIGFSMVTACFILLGFQRGGDD